MSACRIPGNANELRLIVKRMERYGWPETRAKYNFVNVVPELPEITLRFERQEHV